MEQPTGSTVLAPRDFYLQVAAVGLLLCLVYYQIATKLAVQWVSDANYSHGFFVPVFCAWLLWKERKRLAAIPSKPANAGLIVIAFGLAALLMGEFGAELFLSRSSLLILLAGLAIHFRGWRFFRAILFPWAVLFLVIPLPQFLFNQVALPLQFQASALSGRSLSLLGYPVLRDGNIIHLPALSLNVAKACSGLRSLVLLITLSVLYSYLFESRMVVRIVLILSAIPIAVIANVVRIVSSGIVGERWGAEEAAGFLHTFSGWLVFVVSFFLIWLVHAVVSRIRPRLASPA